MRPALRRLFDSSAPELSSKYRVGGAAPLEMWIFWDGRILNYGLAGRSQNVLFHLHLIDTNLEYKKIDIFYSDPLPDLRPYLEASRYAAFAYVFGF